MDGNRQAKVRSLARRALRPNLGLLGCLTAVCVPLLAYPLVYDLQKSPLAYAVYLLSAYLLAAWCVRLPAAKRRIMACVYRRPLGRRYLTDLTFRGHVSLVAGTAVNVCYALLKLGAGIYYRSFWFGAVAVYYLILTAARILLLRAYRTTDARQEYRAVRRCGYLLFLLNIALSAVTVQMVVHGRGYRYPDYLIYAVALYAFYAVTVSVVNLFRFRRLHHPVLGASKILGLATALVSMLSLQTAMFASFGGTPAFQKRMNAITGGAVCLILLLLAGGMVVHAGRRLRGGSGRAPK